MILKGNKLRYEWQPNWAGLNGDAAHSHGGVAQDRAGNFYMSFNDAPYVRVFDAQGKKIRDFELSGREIHCLTTSQDKSGEWLWDLNLAQQKITKNTLAGKPVKSITKADFKLKEKERLSFTAISIDPRSGCLWVTDGYGMYGEGTGGNRVYCFNADLKLQFSFDGTEAACGSLKEPHWIIADTRRAKTEIYIADRSNHRLVVYSPEGKFLRVVEGGLLTPSGFSIFDDKLVVVELKGRLHILDIEDNIIETLADGSSYSNLPGWPNRIENGKTVCPHSDIAEGKFNSPHGVVADKFGNIYVHEWLQGIRITKLKKVG